MFWKQWQTPSVFRAEKQPSPPVQEPLEQPGRSQQSKQLERQGPAQNAGHGLPLAANAGVRRLVRTGADHTTAALAPIRLSILRRESRPGAWSEFMAPPD